jgi:hypothetical protein
MRVQQFMAVSKTKAAAQPALGNSPHAPACYRFFFAF